jgi:hypothetical protein
LYQRRYYRSLASSQLNLNSERSNLIASKDLLFKSFKSLVPFSILKARASISDPINYQE